MDKDEETQQRGNDEAVGGDLYGGLGSLGYIHKSSRLGGLLGVGNARAYAGAHSAGTRCQFLIISSPCATRTSTVPGQGNPRPEMEPALTATIDEIPSRVHIFI